MENRTSGNSRKDRGTDGEDRGRAIDATSGSLEDGNSGLAGGIGGVEETGSAADASGAKDPQGRAAGAPKKRGWPKGRPRTAKAGNADAPASADAGAPTQKKRVPIDRAKLARKIYGAHQIGAAMTGVPLIALQQAEADALADGVAELGAYYDLSFDGPGFAVASLALTAFAVYAPRVAIVVTARRAAKAQRASAPANPLDVGPGPMPGGYDFTGDIATGLAQ